MKEDHKVLFKGKATENHVFFIIVSAFLATNVIPDRPAHPPGSQRSPGALFFSEFKTSLHPGELIHFGGLLSVISKCEQSLIYYRQPFSNSMSWSASQGLIWETHSCVHLSQFILFAPVIPSILSQHPFIMVQPDTHLPKVLHTQSRAEHWQWMQFYFVYLFINVINLCS